MKLCIITNYTRGYINDSLILDSLLKTLDLTSEDIFDILDIIVLTILMIIILIL